MAQNEVRKEKERRKTRKKVREEVMVGVTEKIKRDVVQKSETRRSHDGRTIPMLKQQTKRFFQTWIFTLSVRLCQTPSKLLAIKVR